MCLQIFDTVCMSGLQLVVFTVQNVKPQKDLAPALALTSECKKFFKRNVGGVTSEVLCYCSSTFVVGNVGLRM
jgi:hypothetical protein